MTIEIKEYVGHTPKITEKEADIKNKKPKTIKKPIKKTIKYNK